jgi:hypothetical protein
MAGNAGLGRPKGSRNRFTADLLARMSEGRTPLDFASSLMHTQDAPIQYRLQAAKLTIPYVHTRPAPISEPVELELPEVETLEGLRQAVSAVLQAVASGAISAEVGRDIGQLLDVQRKSLQGDPGQERRTAEEAICDDSDREAAARTNGKGHSRCSQEL